MKQHRRETIQEENTLRSALKKENKVAQLNI